MAGGCGFPEVFQGFRFIAFRKVSDGPVAKDICIVRFDLKGRLIIVNGLIGFVELIAGIQSDHIGKVLHSFLELFCF
jgi:hypothetical protein